jgi:transcriptional regulator with XRE-family HTH domain
MGNEMHILEYMEFRRITNAQFAKRLGISVTKFNQYAYGKTIPRREMMRKICLETEGLVTANDFYGTTQHVIEKQLLEIARLSKLAGAEQQL